MRKFIYLSSSVLFLLTGIGLIIIGAGEKDSMMVGLFGASISFIYTAYWNFFSYVIENQNGSNSEYFTYNNAGSRGIGISYNKITVVPFFLGLFTSVSLAITTFFLAVNHSTEDIAIGSLCLSFLVSAIITIYFTKSINKALCKGNLNEKFESKVNIENVNDDIGFKIAFFFASIATLGLFPLVYYMVKKVRRNN